MEPCRSGRNNVDRFEDHRPQPALIDVAHRERMHPSAAHVEALNVMEQRKITSIIVTGDAGAVAGVVHLHDLWRTELI